MKAKRNTTKPTKAPKLSRTHAPDGLSPIDWQRALRRQFGREQSFDLENIGAEPIFSEFRVGNPQSKSSYRVAIRGLSPGDNFCSCPDYATNELGTCKHIEFTLAQFGEEARRQGGVCARLPARDTKRLVLRFRFFGGIRRYYAIFCKLLGVPW